MHPNPRHAERDDTRLFRALLLTFTPLFLGWGAVACAWALPPVDALPNALRYADVRVDRVLLPPLQPMPAFVLVPPEAPITRTPTPSAPTRPVPGPGSGRPPGVVRHPEAPSGEGIPRFAETMRGQRGRIESCAQATLKRDPSLQGRIELSWEVVDGRTTDVHIVGDRVEDAEFSRCVQSAVRALRFADESYGSVDGYTWVMSGR